MQKLLIDEKIKQDVINKLVTGSLSTKELVESFPEAERPGVEDTVWKLMGLNQVVLTSESKLTLPKSKIQVRVRQFKLR